MENRTLGTTAITFFIIFLSVSIQACYRTPRQLGQIANGIQKHHGNQRERQDHLADAFKFSISKESQPYKPEQLHSIVAAVAHKSPFKPLQKKRKIIDQAIDEFHAVAGFSVVLSRVIEGAQLRNKSHFIGAVGELEAALEELENDITILSFNKTIRAPNGRPLTEIDFETEDEEGTITWHEIKTRKESHKNNRTLLRSQKAQRKKQLALARKAGVQHKLDVRLSC